MQVLHGLQYLVRGDVLADEALHALRAALPTEIQLHAAGSLQQAHEPLVVGSEVVEAAVRPPGDLDAAAQKAVADVFHALAVHEEVVVDGVDDLHVREALE